MYLSRCSDFKKLFPDNRKERKSKEYLTIPSFTCPTVVVRDSTNRVCAQVGKKEVIREMVHVIMAAKISHDKPGISLECLIVAGSVYILRFENPRSIGVTISPRPDT